jgi:hypothetical protein
VVLVVAFAHSSADGSSATAMAIPSAGTIASLVSDAGVMISAICTSPNTTHTHKADFDDFMVTDPY